MGGWLYIMKYAIRELNHGPVTHLSTNRTLINFVDRDQRVATKPNRHAPQPTNKSVLSLGLTTYPRRGVIADNSVKAVIQTVVCKSACSS